MMKNTKDNSQEYRFLVLAMMMLLPVRPLRLATAAPPEKANAIRIPLRICDESDSSETGWKAVGFRGKPANKVSADKQGLHIKVQHSVSLLVHCLSEQAKVHSVVMRGAVTGLPEIPEGREQGDEEADDFAVRLGLVVPGTRKPGPVENLFVPELVRRLCELTPDSKGIDHVLFLNLANDPSPKWRRRIHPLGKGLLREEITCTKTAAGDFILRAEFKEPLAAFALCICCDGDDTQSEYRVTVTEIQLNPDEKETGDRIAKSTKFTIPSPLRSMPLLRRFRLSWRRSNTIGNGSKESSATKVI
ncbi:MAG: hypothetical protein ACYTEK_21085, partial [Planctomycetota bacterium]